MDEEPLTWRTRWTWTQTRGRQIERQAGGLREALVRLADRTGTLADVETRISAIREQLTIAEKLARQLHEP